MIRWTLAVLLCAAMPATARSATAPDFIVAADGRDAWSGHLAAPNRARSDGPFATVERAQQAARALRRSDPARRRPIVVAVRGGVHYLAAPLVFTAEDSGTAASPTIYAAYGAEQPVLSGGVRLTGWQRQANGRWTLHIPRVASGAWSFSQLFVNGERRPRPRLPKKGYYFIAGDVSPSPEAAGRGADRFRFKAGEIRADWANLGDVEMLGFQNWTMMRMRLRAVDEERRIASLAGHTGGLVSYAVLPKGNRYLLENVKEALSEPGEWYLDRKAGDLTYIPRPGEDPARAAVVAPRLEQLVRIDGGKGRWVDHLLFRGLTFAHTNWNCPPGGSGAAQAEADLGAAIAAEGARDCALEGCTVRQTGAYAISWGVGCKRDRVEDCVLTDLSAGGVKIGEGGIQDDEELVADHNVVRNCLIAHGGRVQPAAVGVWIGHSPANTIEHNDIVDFYYTGISAGWSWGYGRSLAHDNRLAYNHIRQIGQGVLSDMGGIYTLGLSPGSVLDHNLIHDVESYSYGGWGIYFDEGTTDILAENNIVYRTKTGGFHQHYGKENRVFNNVFALAREGQVIRSRPEEHRSFVFERNIVYWTEGPLLGSNWSGDRYTLDYNDYWNPTARTFDFAGMSFADWQKKGQDVHSIAADPRFVDPVKGDFRLKPGSPALALGFKPIDMAGVGRQGKIASVAVGEAPRAFPPPPPPPPAEPISDDFEDTPVGDKPNDALVNEENAQAVIRVTDEVAATGKHSLKFTDGPGQQARFNPHMYYQPGFTSGLMRGSFDFRREPGAVFYHEWRDNANPYHSGPWIRVEADGSLMAAGRKVGEIPVGVWVHFDVTCGLGDNANGKWDLTVTLPGRVPPIQLRDLPGSPAMRTLTWMGFVADADGPGVFYIDNVRLAPAAAAGR